MDDLKFSLCHWSAMFLFQIKLVAWTIFAKNPKLTNYLISKFNQTMSLNNIQVYVGNDKKKYINKFVPVLVPSCPSYVF